MCVCHLQGVFDLAHVRHEPEVDALQPRGLPGGGEHLIHVVHGDPEHLAVTSQARIFLLDLHMSDDVNDTIDLARHEVEAHFWVAQDSWLISWLISSMKQKFGLPQSQA